VLSFDSGQSAMGWLASHPSTQWPDLLLCDIMLGDEDGYSVMQRVRQLEAERGVPTDHRMPAVALTGLAQPDDRVRALMAGFQVHLVKPIESHELVFTLYTLAGRAGPPGTPSPPTATHESSV
jgi:ATP-binding cassette subfamily B protein